MEFGWFPVKPLARNTHTHVGLLSYSCSEDQAVNPQTLISKYNKILSMPHKPETVPQYKCSASLVPDFGLC